MSQSPTVSFEVLLTLSQRAKLQMYLSCLFRFLHRIECVTFFLNSLRTLRTCRHAVDLVSLEIPLSQQRSPCSQNSDVARGHDSTTHVRGARFLTDVAGPYPSASLSLSYRSQKKKLTKIPRRINFETVKPTKISKK